MIILVTIVICSVPAVLVLLPFIKRFTSSYQPEDESSLVTELERRWDSAIDGLRSTELEWEIGNLEQEDYQWLKTTYTREAVVVLKAMDVNNKDENFLLEQFLSDLDTKVVKEDKIES